MSSPTQQQTDALLSQLFTRHSNKGWLEGGWRKEAGKNELEAFVDGVIPAEWANFLNELALTLSRKFLRGDIDFELADSIINSIYADALSLAHDDYSYPNLFDRIYQAFDDGEWDHHGKSEDPIAEYTVPDLRLIVEEFGSE